MTLLVIKFSCALKRISLVISLSSPFSYQTSHPHLRKRQDGIEKRFKQGNNQRSRNKNSIDDTINDIDNDNDTFSANDLNVKFKSHFNTIMKIFNYLSPFYQQCHLAEINEEITNLFLSTTHNFYNPDNFYPYYYRELDDKGFPISSNASNRNDDMLTKRTNNEDADYEERRKLLLSENRIDFLKKNTNSNELDSSTFVPDKQKIDLDLFFSYFKLFGKRNSFARKID